MNLPPPTKLASQLSKLGRPQNTLYAGLLAAGAAWLSGASGPEALACFLLIWTTYALAAGYNNLRDVHTDRLNKRTDNPLVHTTLPKPMITGFLLGHGALALLLQIWLAQPASVAIFSALFMLSVAYSHPVIRLQARGWLATLSLSLCYGVLPLLLGLSQGEPPATTLIAALAILQALLVFPLLAAKDYKDLKGDQATHKKTPLVRYGVGAVRGVSGVAAVAAAGLYANLLLSYNAPVDGTIILVTAYLVYVGYLHAVKGRISRWQNKTFSLLLLGMSLYAVALALDLGFAPMWK
jgi:4-hydroxybenzoate polyprenyltransferase